MLRCDERVRPEQTAGARRMNSIHEHAQHRLKIDTLANACVIAAGMLAVLAGLATEGELAIDSPSAETNLEIRTPEVTLP
jgi:hypothetical protein